MDRCAGRRLAGWLRTEGHDVLGAWELGADPGDRALLEHAANEHRVLVTIDTDFGELIFLHGLPHAGLIRLPDVPFHQRIAIIGELIASHRNILEIGAVITVRGERVRISSGGERH